MSNLEYIIIIHSGDCPRGAAIFEDLHARKEPPLPIQTQVLMTHGAAPAQSLAALRAAREEGKASAKTTRGLR